MRARTDRKAESGMVTVEAAIVIPLVALFGLALIWMVLTVIAQIQVVDAARDAARSLSRGDDRAAAVAHARGVAPADATVAIRDAGGSVTVTVEVDAAAPRWLLVPLPAVHLRSQATVPSETGSGRAGGRP